MKMILDEKRIKTRLKELASEINEQYAERPLTVVGIMTGSIVFLSDMVRLLELPLKIDVVVESSYTGPSRGEMAIDYSGLKNIDDRDVLIVDDIFDSGKTLSAVSETIKNNNCRSVKSLVFLQKSGQGEADNVPDFIGFNIPREFVVGYGLDYRGQYRNLPFVATLDDELEE